MKTLKFKTNINCNNCLAKVSPLLDKESEILKWNVDISVPDKILTVETDSLTEKAVIEKVGKAGFKAEAVNN